MTVTLYHPAPMQVFLIFFLHFMWWRSIVERGRGQSYSPSHMWPHSWAMSRTLRYSRSLLGCVIRFVSKFMAVWAGQFAPMFHHFLICENTLCAVGADTIRNRLPRGIFVCLCVCYCYNVSTISAPCGNILLVLCNISCEIGFSLCNICRRPGKVNNMTQNQNPAVASCQAIH